MHVQPISFDRWVISDRKISNWKILSDQDLHKPLCNDLAKPPPFAVHHDFRLIDAFHQPFIRYAAVTGYATAILIRTTSLESRMSRDEKTLGAVLTKLRTRNGWTLKEMSQRSGIPMSTLSKVEHGRLSLTYDKLQKLGERLDIRMADLFAEDEREASPVPIMGRRSIGTMESAVRVDTPNYEYRYVCTELRNKRMVPVLTRVHVRSIADFGDLVRHPGRNSYMW
ncbi:helix-turn-helix domain-containing protein [Rhizorhabdus histidinilytica]